MNYYYYIKYFILSLTLLFGVDGKFKHLQNPPDPFQKTAVAKIGDNPFPNKSHE